VAAVINNIGKGAKVKVKKLPVVLIIVSDGYN